MDRIDSYKKALPKLKEILNEPETEINRDAAIKRFEFTYELAWKSLRDFLRNEGVICLSPKNCFREAFKYGIIEDNPLWFRMIEDRNLTVHTYDEEIAKRIYKNIKDYIPLFEEILTGVQKFGT